MRRALGFLILVILATNARAEEVLNVYNWSDYLADQTIPRFEAETGIKVQYDVYDSNDTLQAKLLAGNTGYDIVVPSSHFLSMQIKAGVFRKLDKSKIPNLKNLDPVLMKLVAGADPGNEYGVPWAWVTIGIGYNEAKVKAALGPNAPLDGWDLIFDPAVISKLTPCGVSILDSPTDVLPALLHQMGRDPASQKPADYDAAFEVLRRIRPFITKFSSSGYINDLTGGDLCLVLGYSSDVDIARRRAVEAGRKDEIRYIIPRGGAPIGFDIMAIPKDAPHPDLAMRWIDYIETPEVNAEITDKVFAPSANEAARRFVKPDVANDPTVYPPASVIDTLFLLQPLSPDIRRLETRLWTQMKTGH